METITQLPEAISDRLNGCNGHLPAEPLRLNLGAGGTPLDGYRNLDRKTGEEIYPLDFADNSVDEIRASHVLEHFGHNEVSLVVQDWIRALKPGGKLKIAVPDFEWVAQRYLAGEPINVQGYVMGGQVDKNDHHGVIFDRESLTELLILCGLERIGLWESDAEDCSKLACSLNLQGFKPSGPERKLSGVFACMSVPRFGPLMHPRCAERAFYQLKIPCNTSSSCFWHQTLSNKMEEAIADPSCRYVLTMDFDTVFCAADVLELYRLAEAYPEADAIIPLQSKRGCEQALFSVPGRDGRVTEADLERNLLPCATGHFGLTLIRADSLRKFKRPWMLPEPNAAGQWDQGHIDADISFWKRFRAEGFNPFLAPRVVVGHLEEVVKWPGKDLRAIYQTTSDYDDNGIPAEVAR